MNNRKNTKPYDLEERTLKFAKEVIAFVKAVPQTPVNIEIGRQLIRAGPSVGANYIEANESLGKKDFSMHIKICRKESKESAYWLKLIESHKEQESTRQSLLQEAIELMKIFGSIVTKTG